MNDTKTYTSVKVRGAEIGRLNDQFRQRWLTARLELSLGILSLSPVEIHAIVRRISEHDDFPSDTDPYGEHDFGTFEHAGQKIVWYIAYYAPDMVHASKDPADRSKTRRVLTIMLAEEY